MTVRRIVPNIAADEPERARAFYQDVLGLRVGMDLGWIVTYVADAVAPAQISFAREGGGGTEVPDISVEVDDVDAVHARAVAHGFTVSYGPVDEPWGVRRFYVHDPFGRLVNVLAHQPRRSGLS